MFTPSKKVREVMTPGPVVVSHPDDDLGLAGQLMVWGNVRHLPVVRDDRVVGVISERDILRRQAQVGTRAYAREPVASVMRAPAVTTTPDELVVTATATMLSHHFGCLPVIDRGVLAGILTTTDLLEGELASSLETPATGLPRPVRSIMRSAPAVATADTLLFDAAALMARRNVRHLPIIRPDRTVVGMLSDRDVLAALGDPRRLGEDEQALVRAKAMSVGDVMSKTVIAVGEEEPMTAATDHFIHEAVGALPVVDSDRKLVGILSYLDVLNALR
jgi:CBS domain-containing protein